MSAERGDKGEAFLQRWSRRKSAARQPEAAPVEHPDAASLSAATATPAPAVQLKPPALTDVDFADVDFDALTYVSDYSRFMAPGVPEHIRKKALQKLWLSDTQFTQVDPFQDYAGDFTDKAVAVKGVLATAYKVGRGFLTTDEAAAWDKLGRPQSEHAIIDAAVAVTIDAEPPDQPEVTAFFAASETYMSALYPAESNHFADPAALAGSETLFLVARRAGQAIGCGAILRAANGTAEIKRMWVDPDARRERVGQRLLLALIDAARADGVTLVQLETGISQPQAIALYRQAGFVACGPFGDYQPDPLSVFMELAMASPAVVEAAAATPIGPPA